MSFIRSVLIFSAVLSLSIACGVSVTVPSASACVLREDADLAKICGGNAASCWTLVNKNCMVSVACLESPDCTGSCAAGCSNNKREDHKIENENGYEVTADHAAGKCGFFMENSSCANFGGVCVCIGGAAGMDPCVQWGYIVGDACD